jgi:acyl-CoA synthetase (AMP-forming)/AMP-acid ligase II
VVQAGQVVTLEDIQELARGEIAGYKIPRSISYVDALPLSAQGKVLKRDLRISESTAVPA